MGNIEGGYGDNLAGIEYSFGKCYLLNEDKKLTELRPENTHFSFDTSTYNVHIVPKKETASGLAKRLDKQISELWIELKREIEKAECTKRQASTAGHISISRKWADALHVEKCIIDRRGDHNYLIAFERLYCEESAVNCILGKLQFFKYKEGKYINLPNGKPLLFYPNSPDDGAEKSESEKSESGHCIFNPPLSVYSNSKEIEACFRDWQKKR